MFYHLDFEIGVSKYLHPSTNWINVNSKRLMCVEINCQNYIRRNLPLAVQAMGFARLEYDDEVVCSSASYFRLDTIKTNYVESATRVNGSRWTEKLQKYIFKKQKQTPPLIISTNYTNINYDNTDKRNSFTLKLKMVTNADSISVLRQKLHMFTH